MSTSCSRSSVPVWLEKLLLEKFFIPCSVHNTAKKNERNVYCLDCCSALCSRCLPSHRHHRLLQIRRYIYHDVVRVENLGKLMDCNLIQTYITNSSKVVFLNEREQGRPFRGFTSSCCSACDRPIHYPNLFCCLYCKVKQVVAREAGVTKKDLRSYESLPPPSSTELDDGQLTPDSILESPSSDDSSADACIPKPSPPPPLPVVKKKKRSSMSSSIRNIVVKSYDYHDRRKGVPCRSPLS